MADLPPSVIVLLCFTAMLAAALVIPSMIDRVIRHALDASNPSPSPRTDPLARSLHRQRHTPRPTLLRPLNPIFSFDLYPTAAKELYDRSRQLDEALLDLLCTDPSHEPDIQELHRDNRSIRRHLAATLLRHGPESLTNPPPELAERLRAIENRINALQPHQANQDTTA